MATLDRRTFLRGIVYGLLGAVLGWEVEAIAEEEALAINCPVRLSDYECDGHDCHSRDCPYDVIAKTPPAEEECDEQLDWEQRVRAAMAEEELEVHTSGYLDSQRPGADEPSYTIAVYPDDGLEYWTYVGGPTYIMNRGGLTQQLKRGTRNE